MSDFTVVVGDAAAIPLDDESVDSVVTDPPYGISFMSARWDYDVPGAEIWREVLRVLKPGGRLLAFASARTMHRMWCEIEDAGFVIEDTIAWMYGSGFPKHGSKLKPAYEPICVARKGPVVDLNIDACRIPPAGEWDIEQQRAVVGFGKSYGNGEAAGRALSGSVDGSLRKTDRAEFDPTKGRWPANVILDEEAAALLDEQTGILTSGKAAEGGHVRNSDKLRTAYGEFKGQTVGPTTLYGDSGGASRFFYVAKADRAERDRGLEGMPLRPGGSTERGFTEDAERGIDRNRPVRNHHPTVKPVDLMRHLVRLVTPPGGLVLDPFMGSGTTGIAAIMEGFRFYGIDREPEYVEIARRRIGAAPLSLFGQMEADDAA